MVAFWFFFITKLSVHPIASFSYVVRVAQSYKIFLQHWNSGLGYSDWSAPSKLCIFLIGWVRPYTLNYGDEIQLAKYEVEVSISN